jgi:TFIIF, beta subunit N-terminus
MLVETNSIQLSLKLDNHNSHTLVPKEYNMNITNDKPPNTFVFTEKDFPGYVTRTRGKSKYGADEAARPFSQAEPRLFLDRNRPSNAKVDKNNQNKYRRRRAIPSALQEISFGEFG